MTAATLATFRHGQDSVSPEGSAFLRRHVCAQRNGETLDQYTARAVPMLLTGGGDAQAVAKALHAMESPPVATAETIAIAKARGIDLAGWALITLLGMNYGIHSPYSNSVGVLDDALHVEPTRALQYDICVGHGASWMEAPTPSLVLDVATVGRLPQTALLSMEGRWLHEFVSNPILDPLKLAIASITQDEWAIEIEIACGRPRYLVPTSGGRVYPRD